MYIKSTLLILALAAASASISNGMEWNAAAELIKSSIASGELQGELRETINKSYNKTLINELDTIINDYNFTTPYQENIFDCSDTARSQQTSYDRAGTT